ncbi:class I SAM-dependent methyltransferase [Butyricimonas faecihominis]|jgi:SAM-dependent methyltransferase
MRTRTPIDRWDLSIRKQDRVLEVGSGHNPFYRSNVIVDKYVNDDTHRCGDIKIYPHQQFVLADGEHLPFKDKEFDYVICNQVLEHVENPELFIREICRVGKRGYMETPSLIGEFLFPKEAHRWVILDIDNKLILFAKDLVPGNYKNNYGELFLNYLPYQSLPYKLLGLTEGELMINRYEWKDNIDFIINPQDKYYLSFFTQKWDRTMVEKLFPPRNVFNEIKKVCSSSYHLVKGKIRQHLTRGKTCIPLEQHHLKRQNQNLLS